jgi:serine/threonine protein kinase
MDLMDRGNLAAAVRHSSAFMNEDGALDAVRKRGQFASACFAYALTLLCCQRCCCRCAAAHRSTDHSFSAALASLLQVRLLRRAADVAAGVSYLHSRNVCHGDLKCENVLLRSEAQDPDGWLAKVADFGLSRALAHGQVGWQGRG